MVKNCTDLLINSSLRDLQYNTFNNKVPEVILGVTTNWSWLRHCLVLLKTVKATTKTIHHEAGPPPQRPGPNRHSLHTDSVLPSLRYLGWCKPSDGLVDLAGVAVASAGNGVSDSGGVAESGVAGVGDGGGLSVGDSLDHVIPGDGDGPVDGLVDGGGVCLGDLLDGVGAGLVHQGLVDGLVGPHGAGDLLGSESGDVLEDGLGNVGGPHDGGGLVGGDGGGDVGLDGLGHGVGQGGDLGGHLGVGVSLGGGVGEVAAEPVVLDGGAVVRGRPDEGGGAVAGEADLAGELGGGQGTGQQAGEGQEGL